MLVWLSAVTSPTEALPATVAARQSGLESVSNRTGVTMRFATIAILAAAAVALAAASADAATKKRSRVAPPPNGELQVGERGEAGVTVRRTRTRVIVTKRSYLDAGTEVYPGSLNSRDYVFIPNLRGPMDLYLPNENAKSVLPHPWWLFSTRAPGWGY
jgi:hypothetical protein